jgi:hypothetical protein
MILRSTADRPVHCSQKNASKITERIPASAYSGVARAQIVSLYTKTDVTDYFLKIIFTNPVLLSKLTRNL